MMAQTVYTSAIWGVIFWPPPRQTNKSNWGVEPPNPPGNSHTGWPSIRMSVTARTGLWLTLWLNN